MAHAGLLLLAGWILFLASTLIFTRLGRGLLPDFDEGTVQLTCILPAGASLKASNVVSPKIEDCLHDLKKQGLITGFLRRTGRSELEEHADPVNENEFQISINPDCGKSREEVKEIIHKEIKEKVPQLASIEPEQPLKHLMNEMLSGVKADIAIRIYGDDLNTLSGAAEKIKQALTGIDGLMTPTVDSQKEVNEIHIKPKLDQLVRYNVHGKHLKQWVETALRGVVVSEVLEGQRRFDLLVRLQDDARTEYSTLGKLRIDLPSGKGWVPLEALADIDTYGRGANMINHDNGRRRIVVKCLASGRDVGSILDDIQTRIKEKVALPPGYFIEYGGQFESQQEATKLISILSAISIVGMFVVLYMLYPSSRIVLQILNALPMAFIGGVAALVLTRQPVTVAALVGFISLGGISARNGILLVSHYLHLMKHEGEGFSQEMVLRGSLERLSPVLMTALTAGIGLVPLVIGGHQPGREILYPVATVILGGLVTSTLCEFLLHPGLFWKFSGKAVSTGEWAAENAE
jgi:HME family heavy-metal exporter